MIQSETSFIRLGLIVYYGNSFFVRSVKAISASYTKHKLKSRGFLKF